MPKKRKRKTIHPTVDVLGTPYQLIVDTPGTIKGTGNLGYAELHAKKIVIVPMPVNEASCENVEDMIDGTIRHELVHAFLYESGLDRWCGDELLVDWIALQLPRITTACDQAIAKLDKRAICR